MRMRSDQLGVETGNADDGLQVLWALSAVWAADTDRRWRVANGASRNGFGCGAQLPWRARQRIPWSCG